MLNNKKRNIQKLIIEIKKGNKDAKKELIKYYTEFITKNIKNNYDNKNFDEKKLIQAGIDAIYYAIEKYDINSNLYFSSIVYNIIINRINSEARFQQNLNTHKKQVNFYIKKALQGDYQAKEEVAKYYIRQIDRLIENKYNSEIYDKEVLKEAGYTGIAAAIKNYNNNLTIPFSTYINNYINYYISKEVKNSNKKLINAPIKNSYYYFINDIEDLDLIKICIDKLEKEYKDIIVLHLYEEYSFEKIGEMYNLTRARIHQLYKKGIEIIKEEVTEKKKNKKKIKKQSKNT